MLSVKAEQKIYNRLEKLCGEEISPDRICALTDEQIRGTGMSNAKVEYIRNITNAITNGTLDLEALKRLSDEESLIGNLAR